MTAQDGLGAKLAGKEVVRRIREAPFVQIPLGVTEDRLVGTVDIEASMKEGRTVFQVGAASAAQLGCSRLRAQQTGVILR